MRWKAVGVSVGAGGYAHLSRQIEVRCVGHVLTIRQKVIHNKGLF